MYRIASILSNILPVRKYVLHNIETDERIKRILGAGILADNPILEKRTSRSSVDLGHWFEACWMPDRSADFATASRIMIFTGISRRPTMYIRDHLNVET